MGGSDSSHRSEKKREPVAPDGFEQQTGADRANEARSSPSGEHPSVSGGIPIFTKESIDGERVDSDYRAIGKGNPGHRGKGHQAVTGECPQQKGYDRSKRKADQEPSQPGSVGNEGDPDPAYSAGEAGHRDGDTVWSAGLLNDSCRMA